MKELMDWQKRVIAEKEYLDSNIKKLGSFIIMKDFSKLEKKDQELLERQEALMKELSRVLEKRIDRF